MGKRLSIKNGDTFNLLTIIKEVPKKGNKRRFLCKCICGVEKEIQLRNLVASKTKSCGKCAHPKYSHRMTGIPTYVSWIEMKRRCDTKDKKRACYNNYAALGITYVSRWNKFENFYKDMGDRPHGKTLDRINVYKGYSKENCRWATKKEQGGNKRNTKRRIFNGKEYLTHFALAKEFNIHPATLTQRLKNGWTLQKALTTKPGNNGKK